MCRALRLLWPRNGTERRPDFLQPTELYEEGTLFTASQTSRRCDLTKYAQFFSTLQKNGGLAVRMAMPESGLFSFLSLRFPRSTTRPTSYRLFFVDRCLLSVSTSNPIQREHGASSTLCRPVFCRHTPNECGEADSLADTHQASRTISRAIFHNFGGSNS